MDNPVRQQAVKTGAGYSRASAIALAQRGIDKALAVAPAQMWHSQN